MRSHPSVVSEQGPGHLWSPDSVRPKRKMESKANAPTISGDMSRWHRGYLSGSSLQVLLYYQVSFPEAKGQDRTCTSSACRVPSDHIR